MNRNTMIEIESTILELANRLRNLRYAKDYTFFQNEDYDYAGTLRINLLSLIQESQILESELRIYYGFGE